MEKLKLSKEEVDYLINQPFFVKIPFVKQRIREFVNMYGTDGTYISYSGGLDSTCMKYLIQEEMGFDIPSVFCDTYFEWPELRDFVKKDKNTVTIKPKVDVKKMIKDYGYCFPSKEVAMTIYNARNFSGSGPNIYEYKLRGLDKDGRPSAFRKRYQKFWKLYESDIPVSSYCCILQKEEPLLQYEAKTGRKPFVATRAAESDMRRTAYMKSGCNTFLEEYTEDEDGNLIKKRKARAMSRPFSIMTQQDILMYANSRHIEIAEPYGDIVEEKLSKNNFSVNYSCMNCPRLRTSGEQRTGCVFCPIGIHLPVGYEKYMRLRRKHPQMYDYVMEELDYKRLFKYVKENFAVNWNGGY